MGYTPPLFNVRKVTGGYSIYPDGVTTDDLFIYANPVDTVCKVEIQGTGGFKLYHGAGSTFKLYDNTTNYLTLQYTTPDTIISTGAADKNLSLVTSGAGLLKYGTYVAGAKADSIGYIEILDNTGTSRRLMVQSA